MGDIQSKGIFVAEVPGPLNRWGIETRLARIVESTALGLFVLGGAAGVAYDNHAERTCPVVQTPTEFVCQSDEGVYRDVMVFAGSGILADVGTLVFIGASAAIRRR